MEMTIAGLARAGNVGVETVRYYQRRGLLKQPKTVASSIRRYSANDVRRLRFIRSAQAAGFTLDQVAKLLALDAVDDRRQARELANQQIAVLDAKISGLKTARTALRYLARQCGARKSGPCPIIQAFENS